MSNWKEEIRQRLVNLKLDPAREAEIVEELAQHMHDRYAELLAGGVSPDEAAREALAELSESDLLIRNLHLVEHPVKQEPIVLGSNSKSNMIADLWQDLRYAMRSLRRQAMLSSVIIATLILGIGISAGVFSFYNAGFLRPRVDKEHDTFVKVYAAYTNDRKRFVRARGLTLEDYLAVRDGAESLGNLVGWAQFEAPFGQGNAVAARAALVSCNFFSLYDPGQPMLGRLLQPGDCSAATPVVVLSERLWRNVFGADPQIVGKSVQVNGQPVIVVGVTPNFAGMREGSRAWLPYTLETYLKLGENILQPGEANYLEVEGRLQPGFSRREAAAELKLLASQQERLHPGRYTALAVTDGSSIKEPGVGGRMILLVVVILGLLTIFVMIICVNVTMLLLSRAAARRKEIAVRLALGAGRWRLVRMLFAETFLLAGMAGLASLYLAYRLPGILLHWLTNPLGETGGTWWSLAPDWRVFAYLTMVTMFAGTMAGLTPALQSLKVNLSDSLKGRPSLPGVRGSRLHGLLIGTQVALSFFLMCGSGFCVRVAFNVATFEPGFEVRQLLWANVRMRNNVNGPRSWEAFQRSLEERLKALPGVQSVAFSTYHPFNDTEVCHIQATGQAMRRVESNLVSANYFSVLGIPIVGGRALREGEPLCGKGVCAVVVSQRLAREFWPNGNPLGQTLRTPEGDSFEVVGIARDVASTRGGEPDGPLLYLPLNPIALSPANPSVRFSGDPATTMRAVTTTIQELDPEFSVRAQTFQGMIDHMLDGVVRITQLIVFLCAIAVGLAVIGIYGVVAFAVTQRTREMGIRLALGAQKKDIYRTVLCTNGLPIAVGLLIGLVFTVAIFTALTPLLRDVRFGTHLQEPMTYASIAPLLGAAGLGAMLGPARRATHVHPMADLREE